MGTNKPNTRTTFYNRQSFAQQDAGEAAVMEEDAELAAKAPAEVKELPQDGAAAKAEKEADRAEVAAKVDEDELELKRKIVDNSEKTSILEPIAYENRYNYYLP